MSDPQFSLFSDPIPPSTSLAETVKRGKPASKAQAAFRRLIDKIDRQREILRDWQVFGDRYRNRLATEMLPVQTAFRQTRKSVALLLDSLLTGRDGPRGRNQRRKLRTMLLDLLQDMLLEQDDPELVAIHDRHSDVSHAQWREGEMAMSQAMVEEMLGVDLGDDHGAGDLDELFAEAARRFQAQSQQDRAPRRRRESEAARAKREQAEREVSQSVRDVYRKLASALHPDRETDAAQRDAKTLQMQRANQAYEAGDLLELLTLQLEIEQIDARHLAALPEARLAHYNQVLRQQLAELEGEIKSVTAGYRMAMQVPDYVKLRPGDVDQSLSDQILHLKQMDEEARADLESFRDPAYLAQAIRNYRPQGEARDEMDELPDMEELAAMAELMALLESQGMGADPDPPRARRRKKSRT